MDDLTGMISNILNDPAQMQQLREVASSLGLSGGAQEGSAPPQETAQPTGGGLDLSALTALLGGAGEQASAQPAPAAQGPDLSQLSSLLGGLVSAAPTQPQAPQPAAGGNPLAGVDLSALSGLVGSLTGGQNQSGGDLSALTALLGAGQPQQSQPQGGGLPFDMGTLMKLQQAMSSVGANQANIQLLRALQPRLKEKRARKVDDAIRVMQLIQFLPLIKESGLFGDGDAGLGGIVSGIGSGIENALGGLLGRRGPG